MVEITPSAQTYLLELLSKQEDGEIGIRILSQILERPRLKPVLPIAGRVKNSRKMSVSSTKAFLHGSTIEASRSWLTRW